MRAATRVLVLDDDPHTLDGVAELLRGQGYDVEPSASYQAAKALLTEQTYDLLIADVRLRSFNGLHLVQQCHREHPNMALMVLTGSDEALLEIEARRYGARLVRKPVQPEALFRDVAASLAQVRCRRRWPRTPIASGFRVKAGGRPAVVIEVGYGGLCLEIAGGPTVPESFDVVIPGIGLTLPVRAVWSRPGPTTVTCRAALASDTARTALTWRTIVDRLSA
jgi:CheY-like chemotaxis protein